MTIGVLNIGNTHCEFALFDGEKFHSHYKDETANFDFPNDIAEKIKNNSIKIGAASVVPAKQAELEAKYGKVFNWISATNCSNFIDFSKYDASTLGADRVANACAAAAWYPLPAMVIDFGTAITVELIDKYNVFIGGGITPGRKLMRQALNTGTAQLPMVPLSKVAPNEPGINTTTSIAWGIDRGVIGLVFELIMASQMEFDSSLTLIATGGDAPFFTSEIKELQSSIDDFTLHGIKIAAFGLE